MKVAAGIGPGYGPAKNRRKSQGNIALPVSVLLKSWILALAVILAAAPAMAGPSLLFDAATGEVISQDRAGEPWYPASLTKLMTAYVVFGKLRSGEMKLDQKLTVSPLAASQPPSKLGMRAGSDITVDLALQVLLVYSANDMAYVLAEGTSGTYERFVDLMNEKARHLGMTATHYANPNGLFDARQITTARDIGILSAALLREYPEYARYFRQPYVAIGKRKLMNRNALIRQMKTADGMKTGFVCNSGYNLVASAVDPSGRRLVAVVLGAQGGQARADIAQMLLTSGFARQPQPQQIRLGSVRNAELGDLVPADMTRTVCKGKGAAVASASALSGWGVSLGRYDDAETADMALRGRLLGARDILQGASRAAVVDIPDSQGYTAMVWNLDQRSSLSLCGYFRQHNVYCDVMTPESFASIVLLAEARKMKIEPAASVQGDNAAPNKTKKKKKAKAGKRKRP